MTRCIPARAASGFTLIELLIVIGILGVLAAVLVPQLTGANEGAARTATEANMTMLETGINAFNRAHGQYPPDDFRLGEDLATKIKGGWKNDNGRNTGIESLVVFLSQSPRDGTDLNAVAEHLVNTDADDHGIDIPVLRTRARQELADHWGTPLAYFGKFGLEKTQSVLPDPEAEVAQVKAKRRADGVVYGAGRFQLLSAGPDRAFGTDDDLYWPAN